MATSLVAALWAIAGTALAQTEKTKSSPNSSAQRMRRSAHSSSVSQYLEDPEKVKFANIESEPAFFQRIEKEIKIEEVRLDASDARQGLQKVRVKLSPVEVELLDPAEREIVRAFDPLDSAAANLTAAIGRLRMFHERPTPQAAAIRAGRADAVPFVTRVRRDIKGARRDLGNVSHGLTEGRPSPLDLMLDAHASLEKRIETLPDDERRKKLDECLATIDQAIAALKGVDAQSKDLATKLDGILTAYFAECPPANGPALQLGAAKAGNVSAPQACQSFSLEQLLNSHQAIAPLDEAAADHAKILAQLERVEALKHRAVELAEQADAIVNPTHEAVRAKQVEAVSIIEKAEEQLAEMKRLLAQDAPGESHRCAHCGKELGRTRKVLDPSCVCEQTNDAMQQIEKSLGDARKLTDEMIELLARNEAPGPQVRTAIEELRGDKRVLDHLALALVHGEEFRMQKFNFYPAESRTPTLEAVPDRAFAPLVATYAARESWHYPLYFEDIALERYGHNFGCAQPFVSYGKFLTDLVLLPYNMTLDHPTSMQYDHGLFRPGDDVPHLIYLPRPDAKAALVETVVLIGLAYFP